MLKRRCLYFSSTLFDDMDSDTKHLHVCKLVLCARKKTGQILAWTYVAAPPSDPPDALRLLSAFVQALFACEDDTNIKSTYL